MKKTVALLLALLCMCGLVGCSTNNETTPEYENNELSSGRGFYIDFPKGLRPMMMVNGKLYRCTGFHYPDVSIGSTVSMFEDCSTILPEGYIAIGEISGITEEVPSVDLQLRAGFEATGTVFTNEQTPEVIYVLMTTDSYSDYYVRFASDDLHDNECISYQGRQYRINIRDDICEKIKELPEECVLIGELKYIGSDTIPLDDLETNRIADGYSKALNGREVFADPNDPSILYVYEHQYWKQGDYPAWRVCRLWSECME